MDKLLLNMIIIALLAFGIVVTAIAILFFLDHINTGRCLIESYHL